MHLLSGPVALAAAGLVGQSAASIFPPQARADNIARDNAMGSSDAPPPPAYGTRVSSVSKSSPSATSTSSSMSVDAITMGSASSDTAVLVSSTSTVVVTPLPIGSFTTVNLPSGGSMASGSSVRPSHASHSSYSRHSHISRASASSLSRSTTFGSSLLTIPTPISPRPECCDPRLREEVESLRNEMRSIRGECLDEQAAPTGAVDGTSGQTRRRR